MREFTVAVPDEVLDDLRARLQRTRLPNAIDGIGWEQGTELGYLEELLAYWREDYDWRATEARLNAHEQLLFDVDGQQIHVAARPFQQSERAAATHYARLARLGPGIP